MKNLMELSPRLYRLFVRPPLVTKFYLNPKIKKLLSSLSFENKYVLDFGCGIGSSSFMFRPDYYVGIDCNDKRIKYAKYLYPNYNFILSQESKINISSNSVDYILIMAVLHHIPSEVIEEYLEEFRRILKPDGQIIVIEPCYFDDSNIRNRFMSFLDRGNYIRNENDYLNLFHQQKFTAHTIKRFNKCFTYNELFFIAVPQ